ncbi:STAS domain-containing protein [Pseudonocardia abyssalis]|uniref:STAS domain-containing protein n=1 Tax=Pseudonocardia abyssalis TaxID=2792008 RepID=UPI001CF701A7|nr:STAS domain-containing protein [Pseudonocardia abyssalis]
MFDTIPSTTGDGDAAQSIDTVLTRPAPGTALLTVCGEIDTVTAPHLEAALHSLLDTDDATLVADLDGVTFLASSGLAVLIQAAHRAERSRRKLRLVASGRQVRRPLAITGTDQLFELHEDRASAGLPGPA